MPNNEENAYEIVLATLDECYGIATHVANAAIARVITDRLAEVELLPED